MSKVKDQSTITHTGYGLTSGQDVHVQISMAQPGYGIQFHVTQNNSSATIPARADFVVNTLRNVVLGRDGIRLCIVEHFLAASSLWGLSNLHVEVNGLELPLGDGSAQFWLDLFSRSAWPRQIVKPTISLNAPIICQKADKLLLAVPDQSFSISYHMDWDHPEIGKLWQSWQASDDPKDIASARTFGWLKEHQLLGLSDEVVSLTQDGFSQPLRFPDEPVRHKLLDLLGDLTLSGVNPMAFKARFVSIKAGHEMDVDLARQLSGIVQAHIAASS